MLFHGCLLFLSALTVTTTALPAPNRAPTLTVRNDDQCPPNTNFYICQLNNFRGCCSVDPCALSEGCPDKQAPPTPTCGPDGKFRFYAPEMRTINIPPTDGNQAPTADFAISKSGDSNRTDQIMTFKLPKEAASKTCHIGWSVPTQREFVVKGNGLTGVREVNGTIPGKRIGGADFTFWPDMDGAHTHNVALTPCRETLSLYLALDYDGEVFLEQDHETGWYVDYDC
ncbi:hypothetical protein VTO42DRAFT_1509 [Malbranchea cinnamomea]